MMRGRKGQRDTKPTRLHSMNDIPRDGYTGFPRAWQMSQEKRRWLPPGMADVSRDAPLGGFRAEASITGNTSAYADIAGYDRWAPLSERIQRGMCRDRALPYRHRRTALLSWKIPEY